MLLLYSLAALICTHCVWQPGKSSSCCSLVANSESLKFAPANKNAALLQNAVNHVVRYEIFDKLNVTEFLRNFVRTFRTRCSAFRTVTCTENGVSRHRHIRYFWRCFRTSRRLLGTIGLRCLALSLQNQLKNMVSRVAAENDASKSQNAPVRAGPGLKNI